MRVLLFHAIVEKLESRSFTSAEPRGKNGYEKGGHSMSSPPTRFKGVQHVAIKVHDIDEALRFYTEVLGLRLSERHEPGSFRPGSPGMAFLSCQVNHHDINLVFFPKEASPSPEESATKISTGLHHFALLVEDRREFEAWLHHIQSCGIPIHHGPVVHSYTHPEGNNTPGENRAFYFADPSGNLIEICCDMGQMTPENTIDPQWHAERLRRDGYVEEALNRK